MRAFYQAKNFPAFEPRLRTDVKWLEAVYILHNPFLFLTSSLVHQINLNQVFELGFWH